MAAMCLGLQSNLQQLAPALHCMRLFRGISNSGACARTSTAEVTLQKVASLTRCQQAATAAVAAARAHQFGPARLYRQTTVGMHGSTPLAGAAPGPSPAVTASAAPSTAQPSSGSNASATKLVLVVGIALLRPGSTASDGSGRGGLGASCTEPTVLLAQRPPGKANEGLWEFPGGKVEAGETPERALVRELQEELGIMIEERDLRPLSFASHPYPTFHLLMPLYSCTRWSGEPRGAEGQAVVWATESQVLAGASNQEGQAAQYPLTAADVPLVTDVIRALQQSVL